VPGIARDAEREDAAYAESPLYEFYATHPESRLTLSRYGYAWVLPTVARRVRTFRRVARVAQPGSQPAAPPPEMAAETLTAEVHAEAQALGLSQVGFAPYDERYVFGGYDGQFDTGTVIVCVLEQDWKSTQRIPSAHAERATMRTYSELSERTAKLAEFLHEKGFRAQPQNPGGALVTIHYAVEAGLGQLGLNGQLLTPQAGSRCRLTAILTNAQLVMNGPVDYGIPAICDQCRVCIRRCPPGAIPKERTVHRGVTKTKIKPERCLPVMIRADGCGICMKVCPVQRYGLDAVKQHYLETGVILGKGTDELESFHWIDGRYYRPGEKPRMTRALLEPPGLVFDPTRKRPPSPGASATVVDYTT
jgi:ferredoxin